jgi:hypothetical protein
LEYRAIELALVQIEYLVTDYTPKNYYFIERGWNCRWNFKIPEEVARIRKKEANKKVKEANRKHQRNLIGRLNKQIRENL